MKIYAINHYQRPDYINFGKKNKDKGINHTNIKNAVKAVPVVVLLATPPVYTKALPNNIPVDKRIVETNTQNSELKTQRFIKNATPKGWDCLLEGYTKDDSSYDYVVLSFRQPRKVFEADENGNLVERESYQTLKIRPNTLKCRTTSVSGNRNNGIKQEYSVVGSGKIITYIQDEPIEFDINNREISINKDLYNELKEMLGSNIKNINENKISFVTAGYKY